MNRNIEISIPAMGLEKDELYLAVLESGAIVSEELETRLQEMLNSTVDDRLTAEQVAAFVAEAKNIFINLTIDIK